MRSAAMTIDEAWRQLQVAADLSARRGSLIFHLDLATEVARVAFAGHDLAHAGLAAWVDDLGYRVVAFDAAPLPRAVAAARFDAAGNAQVELAPDRVPALAEALARARQAANAGADAANVRAIVLPVNDARTPLTAYRIVTSGSAARMVVDGQRSLTLTPDGRRIEASTPIALHDASVVPQHDGVSVLAVRGPVPHELHTYLSLKHGVPLLVDTAESGVRWRVEGERTAPAT